MLVPLTIHDNASAAVTMVPAWVFALPDGTNGAQLVEDLRAAAHRVVNKWRLLGGVPKKLENGTWAIEVPDSGSLTAGFTTETLSVSYHEAASLPSPLPPLSSRPSGVLPPFEMPLFRSSTAPRLLEDYTAQNAPVLHIHTTLCTDALAVGVSLSHGIFGGTGIGMVLRALSAELNREEWTPPPLFEENPLLQALDQLEADSSIRAVPAEDAITDWEPATEEALARLTSSATYEASEGENEARWVFLHQKTVDRLVKRVKEEVKEETGGKEYVSTGDVLFAWMLKAAHSSDALTSPSSLVSAAALYHSTSLLSTHTQTPSAVSSLLSQYPHNAAIPYTLLPATTFSSLASTPLPQLALKLHRQVARYRRLEVLKTSWRQTKEASSSAGGILIPMRDSPPAPSTTSAEGYTSRWLLSNQLSVDIASLSIPGLPLLAFYLASEAPGVLDHVLPLQQTCEGVTMSATMRRGRWEGVERAVEELEREAKEAALE